MTNPMQPSDPAGGPPATTPADSPSDPAGYAAVTPHGQGPAPYDIQAPMDGTIAGAFDSANAVGGAGFLYPQGPRQAAAETLIQSPQGFASDGYDIIAGFHGGGGGGWPNDVEPDTAGP
jgi:hypothetical protein